MHGVPEGSYLGGTAAPPKQVMNLKLKDSTGFH